MEIIYAIPGLGTTKELFKNISVPNYSIKVLDWPLPQKNFTLKEYSKLFLKQIKTNEPVNLMGVSFGGMLCSELAEQIEVKKVVLISSCKDISEFPFLLKLVKRFPVHRMFSDKFIRFVARSKRKYLGFEKSFDKIFFEMIDEMPDNYFSRAINYIVNWDKKGSSSTFIRIHGTSDKLLTNFAGKNFHLIKGGSHAMVLNRATEINKILNDEFNGL